MLIDKCIVATCRHQHERKLAFLGSTCCCDCGVSAHHREVFLNDIANLRCLFNNTCVWPDTPFEEPPVCGKNEAVSFYATDLDLSAVMIFLAPNPGLSDHDPPKFRTIKNEDHKIPLVEISEGKYMALRDDIAGVPMFLQCLRR